MDSLKRSIRRSRSNRTASPLWLLVFFGIFGLVGLLLSVFWAVPAVMEMVDSKHWDAVPATVIESSVKRHTSSDSTTYSVAITFEYTHDGRKYQSDRWDMVGGSSSGYNSKQRVVDAHPPGTEVTAYVNPEEPGNAVINPGLSAWALMFLIPVVFFLIGAVGLVVSAAALIGGGKKGSSSPIRSRSSGFSSGRPAEHGSHSPDGHLLLKPKIGRWQSALIFLGIALFWNGIVSVFVFEAVKGWQEGNPEWGVIIFVSIFAAIGLALFGGFLHQLLSLRNPHAKITITPAHPRLGGPLRFMWELTGDTSRLQSFEVKLECRESVVRKSGKNTSTTTHVIYRDGIVNITDRLSMRSGQVEIRLPGDAMHSFKAPNCSIEWLFEVHGEIPNWPDLKEEFLLWIDPHNS